MLLAQNLDQIQSQGLPGFSVTSVGQLVGDILKNYVFYVAAILLLVYLVVGGLQLMLSRGDPKAVQSAQGKITNALIGFAIVLVAYFIVSLLGTIFGLKPFESLFGS